MSRNASSTPIAPVAPVIIGTVVHGQKIGKKFDLPPTMNIEVSSGIADLKQGIYAVKVCRANNVTSENLKVWLPGVAHFGPRPAVQASDSFEVHLFDFNEDWYGEAVQVQMGEYLREVKNFATIEQLKIQIEEDISRAKRLID